VSKRDFEQLYARYAGVISAIARKYAGPDDMLAEDLEQEGAWALCRLDTRRVVSNFDAFVRSSIKYRMVDYLRRFNPRAYESLDARLEQGDQLRVDANGDLEILVRSPGDAPPLPSMEDV
jgi:DNA-directed RNA polymerase specialized sigma24 family protein